MCFSLSLTGVAYSLHIVQLFSFHGNNEVRQHLEVRRVLNLSTLDNTDLASLLYFHWFSILRNKPHCSVQIDAHVGGVNDLAFAQPNKQLCVITCGDDKTIKVFHHLT